MSSEKRWSTAARLEFLVAVPESLKSKAFARSRKPLARQNKGRIIAWMVYWPFSMAWTLLDEPWRLIYEAMARLFQRISDQVWGDLDKDLKPGGKKNA